VLSRSSVGHVSILSGSKVQLLQCINRWIYDVQRPNIEKKTNYLVGFINPHVFNLSCKHANVQKFFKSANAVCVDGVGIKLALLLTRGKWMPRVVAEHLFAEFLLSLESPVKTILIGGQAGETEIAAQNMRKVNENLQTIATLHGFHKLEDCRAFVQLHKEVSLVLIGAGTPKSELLALMAKEICESAVIFHIGGGTLNTYAGTKKRGPIWISRIGFEWVHRFLYEPTTRERYTIGGWVFLKNLLSAKSPVIENRDEPV